MEGVRRGPPNAVRHHREEKEEEEINHHQSKQLKETVNREVSSLFRNVMALD
jgi:hypothetical protein